MFNIHKHRTRKILVLALEFFALAIVVYLLVLPLYPKYKYKKDLQAVGRLPESEERALIAAQVAEYRSGLPANEFAVSPDRIIIPKIGVNAPIVESKSEAYGLSRGAWLMPDTGLPGRIGNPVITAHRFKYLPPHNLTFYLIDKLKAGDLVSVVWKGEDYLYKVRETKIVDDEDMSVLEPSDKAILTLFSCHPVYSTEQRFVVVGELIK